MHYEINTPMAAFHMHNEHHMIDTYIRKMESGQHIAMVSDAGTPGISDPGYLLVRSCIEANLSVEVLPGATAFVPAIVASGLPCDKFVFEGFLPHKKGRQKILKSLSTEPRTLVFYESPHRLIKSLTLMISFFGADRMVSISREITKIFEEHRRGTLTEICAHYSVHPPKGEIVIVVAGFSQEKKPKNKYAKYVDQEN